MRLNAEWERWANAYRIYNTENPEQTIAYEEDLDVAEAKAREEGYEGLILCDAVNYEEEIE